MIGVITACLSCWGNTASLMEQLTIFKINGSKISEHSIIVDVGAGSSLQYFFCSSENKSLSSLTVKPLKQVSSWIVLLLLFSFRNKLRVLFWASEFARDSLIQFFWCLKAEKTTTERDEVWVPTDLSNRKSLLQQGGEFLSLDFSLPAPLHCCTGRDSVVSGDSVTEQLMYSAMMRIMRRHHAIPSPPLSYLSCAARSQTATCAAICRVRCLLQATLQTRRLVYRRFR